MFLIFPDISDSNMTLMYHIGAILNGIPSIVVTSAPPAVSAAWFPPNERVTATSISQMLNNVGTGMSFFLASIIVDDPKSQSHHSFNNSSSSCHHPYSDKQEPKSSRTDLKNDIENYLIILCVPAVVLFICSLIYFPSKPPKPPSRSSREERLDFVKGSLEILRNPSSWMLAIVWSIPQGYESETYIMIAEEIYKIISMNNIFMR